MDLETERNIIIHKTLNLKGKLLFPNNIIQTTKYSILTFLPKNLFEQFSRIANFYFLIIVSLLQFKWAPIAAAAAIMPLTIVIGISAIREAIEDYLRHKSDEKINSTLSRKLINGEFIDCQWNELFVGDIIKVNQNEQIPADIVLLSTNNPNGVSFIETSNLDGESNLKVRQSLKITSNLINNSDLESFNGFINCDLPNNFLYSFKGNIEINDLKYSLDNKQLLLRGCTLKNTQFAIGVIVYTGHDTKIMKNSLSARSKRSYLEKGLNKKLISVFLFIISLSIFSAIKGLSIENNFINNNEWWYFYRNENNKRDSTSAFFILLASNIIIINAMIPVSLYVTLEVVRVFQAGFIAWDSKMYDIETQQGCVPRTTNISDDLGQISYIFSDKTGTITQNVMEFQQCSIGGNIFDLNNLKNNINEEIDHFLFLLSSCHSVIPEINSKEKFGITFQASSPDEGALVLAAAECGYLFKFRDQNSIIISKNGIDINIPILANLEFSSDRKRSSVIIKNPISNDIILYCKGADDTIYSRLNNNSPNKEITSEHLQEFSDKGLRTLCCSYKILDPDYFSNWINRLNEVNCLIEGREIEFNNLSNEIEQDLILLGATAIEDKLQEDVQDTIESLLKANIKLWVITGDKKETAINIGFSCSIISSNMNLIIIDSKDENEIKNILYNSLNNDYKQELGLIVTGDSLIYLLDDKYSQDFFILSEKCKSVICCRVIPLQKALIVETISNKSKKHTLSIGDGANDVGMILRAHVGIGISGKEGRQAVLASDYSFSKFKYLKRLLLVHGRLNLYRNIELIFYSFYKNVCFTLNQFVYGFFCGFSAITMYDALLYTTFNVFFTSAPPVLYAAFDQDVSLDSMEKNPELYTLDNEKNWKQSYLRFWLNLFLGMFHALIAFFIPYFGIKPFSYSNGKIISMSEFGALVYLNVVLLVNIRIAFLCKNWTWFHHLLIWGSILIYPLALLIIGEVGLSINLKGLTIPLLTSPQFWITFFSTILIGFLLNIFIYIFKSSKLNLSNKIYYLEKFKSNENSLTDQSKTSM